MKEKEDSKEREFSKAKKNREKRRTGWPIPSSKT